MINKLLSKLANNEMLSKGFAYGGVAIASVGTLMTFLGAYYGGVKKGVDVMSVMLEEDNNEEDN